MPTTTETASHLEDAIKGGAKTFPLPGLNTAVRVRYTRGGAPVGIYIYGVAAGLHVTPVDNGAGRPPKSVNKFLTPIEITPGNLKKYANYAHKVHKYLENGGKAYAEHWDINGEMQGFKGAPANVYAVKYEDGASQYELVQASTLAGDQCPVCGAPHESVARPVSAEPTTNTTTKKEDTPMKKYTATTISNNAITYHGLFSTLAEAKDAATRIAGVPVKRAGDAYPYEGGVMVAGAHDVILKRHKAGAYAEVSTVEETNSIEVSGTIEAPAPAVEPSPTVEPGGIITTIHTGEGLNVKDRAAIMTPAVQVASNAAVHPAFLKFSHYTATNRLHVAVNAGTLTPVVIDAQGIVCTIDGVEPVTIGDDLTAAIARLLRVMRPLNKLVNARAAQLTPAGSVAAVTVAA